MEEILINIDSRYRDIFLYPNECKFRFNFEKIYKNITSARMISIEVNNSVTYLDSLKKNNFINIHLPDKLNDPDGVKIELDDGLYQTIGVLQNMFNGLFQKLFNTNGALRQTTIDGKPFAEKYFYFFYLNSNLEITFDFNSVSLPSLLANKLILTSGWYSVYGFVLQIQNYITNKYNERNSYLVTNPASPPIDLDNGNFVMTSFDIEIFDRRFRSNPTNQSHDCLRYDPISTITANANNLTTNLISLKNIIYTTYINDTTLFIPQTTTTYGSFVNHGILDKLNANEYIVTNLPAYTLSGVNLNSRSLYHLNIATTEPPTNPTVESTQIYNLSLQVDLTALKVAFVNYFSKTSSATDISSNYTFYYYYSPYAGAVGDAADQQWSYTIDSVVQNVFDSLFSNKQFLLDHKFITLEQFNDPSFEYTSEKDIPNFEIDFSTYILENPVSNGLVNINKMNYPPVGYYLGYRPDLTKTTEQFIFKGIIDSTERTLRAPKTFDTMGDDYIFLRINDWGYIDFFGKKLFAKVLLTTGLGNPKIEDYVNKEYRFRQPIDINKLDIELVDYLGNTIDLGGFDWSFTIELKQIVNSIEKTSVERTNLVFNSIYKN